MRAAGDGIATTSRGRRRSPSTVYSALVATLAIALALALSTGPRAGEPTDVATSSAAATTEVVAIRAKINNKYVSAENAGQSSLIANRTAVGPWETFDLVRINSTDIYLRAHANGKLVCAEAGGGAALISNRDAVGPWETFQLINNSDGTKSLRARANNKLVTAESAGAAPLIANRTAVGPWEKFTVVKVDSPAVTTPTVTTPPVQPGSNGYPDSTNTGVPAGVSMTQYTGPSEITAANTAIVGKRITSCLVIKATGVVIKNSLIQGDCYFNILSQNPDARLQLIDVEIDGLNNPSSDSAVNGSGYTCIRCDVHSAGDGFKAGTNVVIRDSYIHDLVVTVGSHNDGIQSLGTTGLKIIHNRIVLTGAMTSAIILSTNVADAIKNVEIRENLLGGGAWTVYGGYQAGRDVASKVANIQIMNNRFSTAVYPNSGAFGPMTSVDPPVVTSGNVWHDGPKAGRPL